MWQTIATNLQLTIQSFVIAWLAVSIIIEFLTWIDDRQGTLFAKMGHGWLTARLITDDGRKRKRFFAPYCPLEQFLVGSGWTRDQSNDALSDDLNFGTLFMGWIVSLLFPLFSLFVMNQILALSGTTFLMVGGTALLVYLPFLARRYVRCRKQLDQVQATTEVPHETEVPPETTT